MSPTWGLSVATGLVAGTLSWRKRQRRRRVSLYDERPIGMSEAKYARRQTRQRLYRRVAWLAVDAVAGTAFGWMFAHALFLN